MIQSGDTSVTAPRQPELGEQIFDLSGGRLCLDFTNTVGHRGVRPTEYLHTYADLVAWARQAGALTDDEARRLRAEAERRPAAAAAVLEHARRLREALYRLFAATAAGQSGDPKDLALLNAELADALGRLELRPGDDGYVLDWPPAEGALDAMLRPVVRSAVELLTTDERRLVRVCAWEPCAWLFADTTKNRSRQWCDMKVCGNRAKARRHYERKRSSRAG